MEGQATSSICPKGWGLPESNSTAVGSFGGLIDAYSISSDVVKLTSSPLYFVRGGYILQTNSALFAHAGSDGHYWSSTPHFAGTHAYYLYFTSASYIAPSGLDSRYDGYSIRCLAR